MSIVSTPRQVAVCDAIVLSFSSNPVQMEYMDMYEQGRAAPSSSKQAGPSSMSATSVLRGGGGSGRKRQAGDRPSSPVLQGTQEVKDESPEPELDEVSRIDPQDP